MTLDTIRDQHSFTRAVLGAEVGTAGLVSRTDPWLDRLAELEREARDIDALQPDIDARRMVGNRRLDLACAAMGRELLTAVNGDRNHPRFTQFFGQRSPSDFTGQPLGDQCAAVRAWRASLQDPILDRFWPDLDRWCAQAEKALSDDAALSARRANLRRSRAEHAEWVTTQRDALERDLNAQGEAQGEPRGWGGTFFRKTG